jgi:hypothetical protein
MACPLSMALGGLSLGCPRQATLSSRAAAPAQLSLRRCVAPRAAQLGTVQAAVAEVRHLLIRRRVCGCHAARVVVGSAVAHTRFAKTAEVPEAKAYLRSLKGSAFKVRLKAAHRTGVAERTRVRVRKSPRAAHLATV